MNEKKERVAKRHLRQFINNINAESENLNLEVLGHTQSYDEYDVVPSA
jgi:hypothetical protein